MEEVEQLLPASPITIDAEDPASDDARACMQQYFAEIAARFEGGFDPALSTLPDLAEIAPPSGLLLIARRRGRPVGCGALRFYPVGHAELKRMWVAPEARGAGLGRRLLHALEERAREAGATAVRLETNRVLSEAISLYRDAGYIEIEPYNDERYAHHWFEKRLA